MHRVLPSQIIIIPLLWVSLLLQSCSTLTPSGYMPGQAPAKVASKPPRLLLGPDERAENQASKLMPTSPTNQVASINLALERHTFTAHTGQHVNFLRNAQGIWKALVHDPWTGSHSSIPIPVFCKPKSDILSMLQNLYHQAPSIQKYQIHVLPSRQSQCIFLGNLGLPGGMRGKNKVDSLALLEAVAQNALVLVKQILDSGIDPNVADEHGFTPLHSAVLSDNSVLVQLLLDSHANPNVVDKDGYTPLAYASKNGYLEVAKLLLGKNAHPDGIAGEGEQLTYNPLQLALENGHATMVQLLLNNNADAYIPDYYGNLPLQLAVENQQNNVELVSLFLDHNVDPNIGDVLNITPLHVAANCGYINIVKMLLDNGADPNRFDEDGYTPLHWAAVQGCSKIAKLLLENYAQDWLDPNKALHWAVAKGLVAVVAELLEEECDLDNTDYLGGFTPLLIAATLNYGEIGKILLAKGANPNKATMAGLSPLQVAITNNNLPFLKILLQAGVSLNIVDQYGYTPLHMATKYGYREVASLLLEQGADPNGCSVGGNTILYTAAYHGNLDLVKFWLAQGTALNSPNQGSRANALCASAYKGHLDIVDFLLEKGADVHSADQYGYTPLHLAAEGMHIEVINSLLRSGANMHVQTKDGNTFLHILAHTQPELFLHSIQAIEDNNKTLLCELQKALLELFPILSGNSNEDILAMVVDYAQGMNWHIKNLEAETIRDILHEKEARAKKPQKFAAIFKLMNRHQRLGGWHQTAVYKRVHARGASLLQAQGSRK